jgi:BA14K-like protein
MRSRHSGCDGSKRNQEKTPMRPKIFLAISTLALGTALAAVPAIAQQNYQYPTGRAMNDGGFQQSSGAQGAPSNAAPQQRAQAPGGDNRQYYNYAGPNLGGPTLSGPSSACAARFRSYDPATGTFMGFDGIRHPCP